MKPLAQIVFARDPKPVRGEVIARRPCRAFSLLEIMVAVAILTIIMIGLLAMFYQTQRAFVSGATQSDVLDGGRTTMELITRDLQELYPTRINWVTNFAAVDAAPSFVQPLPGGDLRTNVLQEITFIARVNDQWVGTVLVVADSDLGVGTLYRLSTNSPNVVDLNNYLAKAAPGNFHRVTDGVIHLRFEAYDARGLLSTNEIRDGMASFPADGRVDGYVFTSNSLPAYIDVELGILEPKTLANFRARTNNPAAASAYLQRQAGRVHLFKQRVPIRADPSLRGS